MPRIRRFTLGWLPRTPGEPRAGLRRTLPASLGWALLTLLAAGAVLADGPALEEHHVIFVIDQSGSMWRAHGPDDAWQPNDRPGHRIESVLRIYEELQTRLDDEKDTGSVHTLHIVEFAGRVRRYSPAAAIRFDPNNPTTPERLSATKNQLRGQLSPRDLQDGQTHTFEALEEALDIVQGLSGVPPEHILVLLVTDGKPYVEAADGSNLAASSSYKSQLENVAGRLTSRATFDVIGLIGDENRVQYWPTWGPFWDRVSSPDTTYEVKDASEISPLVDEIIRKLLGLRIPQIANNPYYCPPYLRSITFTVYKKKLGGQVELRDSQSQEIHGGLPDVTVTDERTYARFVIRNPTPGLWTIVGTAVEVKVEPFYRRIHRRQPAGATNVGTPETFVYEVLSDQGNPFRELSQYPIDVKLEVVEPAGTSSRVPLSSQGAGLFASDAPYTFTSDGLAQLRLRATTRLLDAGKTTIEVFSLEEPLTVTGNELVILNAGDTLPAVASMRFGRLSLRPELILEKLQPQGEVVQPAGLSPFPDRLLDILLINSDGSDIEGSPGWLDVLATESGHFVAEAGFKKSLLSWHFLARQPVQIFARIRVDDSALNDDYLIHELRRQEEGAGDAGLSFDRAAALPELLDDPLAVPVVARESLGSFLVGLAVSLTALAVLLVVAGQGILKLGYYISDTLRRQTLTVVIQPVGGSDFGGCRKNLTGRQSLSFKGGAVGIEIGDDPDDPEWRPHSLKIRRQFRPWSGRVVVKLAYPVAGAGGVRRFTTEVREGARPVRLDGMNKAEALVEVRRRGKLTADGPAW